MRLIRILIATALTAIAFSTQAQAASRPNIIFIMADDLGYGDPSRCVVERHAKLVHGPFPPQEP